jgi:predicted nucleic acid-binding Zn ribbon protein
MEATIIKEKRFCPECGKEIVGRKDKQFCSDSCRNNHNNAVNKDSTNLMRNINNALRRNYKILGELNPKETAKVEKKVLVKKKFDFEVYTSVLNAKTGNTYFFVYDLGYCMLNNDMVLVLKNEL